MSTRKFNRPRSLIAAAVLTLGCLSRATAGLPDVPPFVPPPPPPVTGPPPVITPPPIHNPPPVHNAPEPATVVLGGIAACVGGLIARRRKRG